MDDLSSMNHARPLTAGWTARILLPGPRTQPTGPRWKLMDLKGFDEGGQVVESCPSGASEAVEYVAGAGK